MIPTRSHGVELRVFIYADGVLDDCDDWDKVTEEDRFAAITIALDWVFDNRQKAVECGVDPDLLEELWR